MKNLKNLKKPNLRGNTRQTLESDRQAFRKEIYKSASKIAMQKTRVNVSTTGAIEIVNPQCPACGSVEIVAYKIEFMGHIRRYCCEDCKHCFSAIVRNPRRRRPRSARMT